MAGTVKLTLPSGVTIEISEEQWREATRARWNKFDSAPKEIRDFLNEYGDMGAEAMQKFGFEKARAALHHIMPPIHTQHKRSRIR